MTESELLAEFVRVDRKDENIAVMVLEIAWEGPHKPVDRWTLAKTLHAASSDSEVADATRSVLSDQRFFSTCGECNQRMPLGWMDDQELCQGCAERNHGVVY